mgnify:CR=1 FL=1
MCRPVVADAFAGDERALGHAEVVEHLRAPGVFQLLSLDGRKRLGGDDESSSPCCSSGRNPSTSARFAEMQAVARHAEPDRRLEVVDQLELHLGRRVGAGAAPHGADAVVDGGAGVEVRHRVHAERKGDVRAVLRASRRSAPRRARRRAGRAPCPRPSAGRRAAGRWRRPSASIRPRRCAAGCRTPRGSAPAGSRAAPPW